MNEPSIDPLLLLEDAAAVFQPCAFAARLTRDIAARTPLQRGTTIPLGLGRTERES